MAAVAPMIPLAWKPPYAMGAALKKKKKKERKKKCYLLMSGPEHVEINKIACLGQQNWVGEM